MQTIRRHFSYANVMATVAVILALGGSAYAAIHLKKNSVGARQLKRNSVTNVKIANGAVNGAKIADGSVGISDVSASLHLICRSGTSYLQGACIQDSPAFDTFTNARNACRAAGGRLPSPAELLTLVARGVTDPASASEFTEIISFDGTNERVEDVDLEGGSSGTISASLIGGTHPYRCVFDPTG